MRRIFPKAAAALTMAAALAGAWCIGYATMPAPAPQAACAQADLTDVPDADFVPAARTVSTESGEKRVCLTFDDGPSKNTEQVLEVLAQEDVPATFFVIAAENNRAYLPLVQQEVERGHQIGLHSCSHEYKEIYASADAYWQDIDALRRALSGYIDVAGIDCLRFPGGSTNTVSHKYGGSSIMKELKAQAAQRGYHSVDWNVCADDAVGGHPSASQVYENTIEDVGSQTTCVVLMHDTAATGTTAEALPDIIAWFRERGYRFCTVDALYAGAAPEDK
jgi:peptidoglycan/xylan/chitin deacetylase (PgdA/CDA1 family)